MTPDKIIVIIGGCVAIGFVYWFFLGKKGGPVPEEHTNHDHQNHDHAN